MKWHRITLRRLMILVALVGLGLGLDLSMTRRSAEFRRRAVAHQGKSAAFEFGFGPGNRIAEYHTRMASKYAQAASCPWFSVDPDPPAPEDMP